MYDQTKAEVVSENETLRRQLRESDKRHALLSGMTEDGATEYAAKLQGHPSRRGLATASEQAFDALLQLSVVARGSGLKTESGEKSFDHDWTERSIACLRKNLDCLAAVVALDAWAASHELGTVHLQRRSNMANATSVYQVLLTAKDSLDLESGWFATADEARAAMVEGLKPLT